MKLDLERFKGTLPYASELLGIYQPLLGWKSKMTEDRRAKGQDSVLGAFSERAISRTSPNVNVQEDNGAWAVTNLHVLDVVSTRFVPRVATELDSIIARVIAGQLPVDSKPTPGQWSALLARPALDAQLQTVKDIIASLGQEHAGPEPAGMAELRAYLDGVVKRFQERDKQGIEVLKAILDREVSVATYLNWLSEHKPELLDMLFYRTVTDPFQDLLVYNQDPLASFGGNGLEVVLSPIGLVHLFRQYFFEFDTFLGPPVGHIWLPPGSTLELVEVTTRRTLTERDLEFLTETTDKTEKNVTVHDELSTAIREENRSDLKFGFGASVNYHNGTVDAGAHADLSLDNSRTSARETAHKQMREQSEKLTSEIHKSFKSSFKTVVETTDTSSRRYMLQNTTNNLINYELRRKMRQV
ncbi:MAG TPA: hypothetical protein VFQ77_00400, partial [Pseudonocardiaceae bacterium]|nr:hypothetical protein [Pseudonocardiaceae bacterium]